MTSPKRSATKKSDELKLPPHPGAEAHAKLMARLKKMTPEEIFLTSVAAGIHKKDGSLTKRYAPSKSK